MMGRAYCVKKMAGAILLPVGRLGPQGNMEEERMSHYYPELSSTNEVIQTELEQVIADQLSDLEDEPASYFDLTQSHVMIELKYLINTRARPSGIVNANKLMQLAKIGTGYKRDPIIVKAYGSGRWLVVDGNSTTINAVHSGWKQLPCAVTEGSPDGALA